MSYLDSSTLFRSETPCLDSGNDRILYLLDRNARQTSSQLAIRTGLTPRQVRYRLDEIRALDIIRGTHAVINYGRLGIQESRVWLKFVNLGDGSQEIDLVQHLQSDSCISWLARTSGSYDLGFTYLSTDLFSFARFVHALRIRHEQILRSVSVNSVLWYQYTPRAYLLEQKHVSDENEMSCLSALSDQKPAELDTIDWEIVSHLLTNARLPTTKIATVMRQADFEVSRSTVARRLERLESEGVITGYTYYQNHQALNRRLVRVLIKSHALDAQLISRYSYVHPNITKLTKLLGEWDFEINFDLATGENIEDELDALDRRLTHGLNEVSLIEVDYRYAIAPSIGSGRGFIQTTSSR